MSGFIPISNDEALQLGVDESVLNHLLSSDGQPAPAFVNDVFHIQVAAEVVATFTAKNMRIIFTGFRKIVG